MIEKNQNGDFPFYGTTTPVNDGFIRFDIVVGFTNFTPINVITAAIINRDPKNRQTQKIKNKRQKRKHGTIWRKVIFE